MATTPRPTFSQREGVVAIPPQLEPGHLSKEARARLWHVFNRSINNSTREGYGGSYLINPWLAVIRDWRVSDFHEMSHRISSTWRPHESILARLFEVGRYDEVLGFIEFVLRHGDCPREVREGTSAELIHARTAYAVVDGDTICPVSMGEEARVINQAFDDLAQTPFHGAKSHLKAAAEFLTEGKYADSVRESIHSVESVARLLTPKATSGLGPALAELESSQAIHGALRAGFGSMYGYSSDEKGIRHPLLEKGAPAVDFYDSAFMIGSCAAFVSYLVGKARAAGLLK